MEEAATQKENARTVEIILVLAGNFPSFLRMTARRFTTANQALNMWTNSPSKSLPLKTSTRPRINESELINAATVRGTNIGEFTPNTIISWLYL